MHKPLPVSLSARTKSRHVSEGETEEVEAFSGFEYSASKLERNENMYSIYCHDNIQRNEIRR